MKFDKDMVLKHKFWVLLAVSLPLILGSLFILVTAVSGDIRRTRASVEKQLKDFTKTTEVKSPKEIEDARREADVEKSKEQVVWRMAWDKQEPLYLWPEKVEKEFNFRSGLFAQQIKVDRNPPAQEAPKDEERLVHGIVRARERNFIDVEGNNKKTYKFMRTTNVVTNPVDGDDKEKETSFEGIRIGDRVSVAFHKGKYFNEPLTDSELGTYTLLNVYLSQIDPLLAQVEPVNEKGEGVVQLKGWPYKKGELPTKVKFLTYLEEGWVNAQDDVSEQAWLAQEDIWIQQELYRLIRLANDYVSKFDGTGGEDKNKVYTFKNPFLEVGVKWAGGNKLQLSLKNLQNRRQSLDIKLRFHLHKTQEPESYLLGGKYLGPAGTPEAESTRTIELKEALRTGVYGVEQVLTWETAAVKRIDQITIGSLASEEIALSHRVFPEGQQPFKKTEKKDPDPAKDARGGAPPFVGFGRGGVPGAGGGNELTKNGLIKNRYLEGSVTPQSRRVPVAVALIVDQEHIDRVQTAFSNSRLRFLTTQVLLNRYPGTLRPQIVEDNPGGLIGPQLPPRGPGGFPRIDPRFGGGERGGVPMPSVAPASSEMETNVELVIYGIVTLYERFPPPIQSGPAADAK
jgi:hypothetical protein